MRRNGKMWDQEVADQLRARGIPVVPVPYDVGDTTVEVVRLGNRVELTELNGGESYVISVKRGPEWVLEDSTFDVSEAMDIAATHYQQRMTQNHDVYSVLDSAGSRVGLPLSLTQARLKAQRIADVRHERMSVVPAGRDVYASEAGEKFYPSERGATLSANPRRPKAVVFQAGERVRVIPSMVEGRSALIPFAELTGTVLSASGTGRIVHVRWSNGVTEGIFHRLIERAPEGHEPNARSRASAAEMSAAAINKELELLDKKRSDLNEEFIEAGRGYETAAETMELSDPLAVKFQEMQQRVWDLLGEVERRAGPGVRRLPRGFGPRVGRL